MSVIIKLFFAVVCRLAPPVGTTSMKRRGRRRAGRPATVAKTTTKKKKDPAPEEAPEPVPLALAKPEPKRVPQAMEDKSLGLFDGLPMTDEMLTKMGVLVNASGLENVHSVVWMPNRSDNHRRHVPSGFAFAVRKTAEVPIVKELFNPDKFFYGTLAVRVDGNSRMRGGTTFSEWITTVQIGDFDKAVPDQLLDFPGSYAGLYQTLQRRPFVKPPYAHEYWLVLQCGAKQQSRSLYKIICDGQAYERTWSQVIFSEGLIGKISAQASDHRRAAAFRILKSLGLEMGNRTLDSFATVETTTHTFDVDHNTDTYVYYSGCTPLPLQTGGGLIMGERPDLGPTILRGRGGKRMWTVPDRYVGAFPVSTGRVSSVLGPWADDEVVDGSFCWAGDTEVHPRLRTGAYRTRDIKWREVEERLGYNHAWPCDYLRPLVVKLADPDLYLKTSDNPL